MDLAQGTESELKNAYAPEALDVHGFRFLTKQDAEKAKVDAGKISYIESHVGYTTATALMAVYEKSIQNKIFGTPVGWAFLQDLRKRLIKMGADESELSSIPMTVSFTHQPVSAPQTETPQDAPKEKPKRQREQVKKSPLMPVLIALNLVLLVLVIAMFVILNYGETATMLNYKQQYTNEYAIMKQELQDEYQEKRKELLERERAVEEKERASGMEQTDRNAPEETTENGGTDND